MTKATYTLWGEHMRDYMDRRVTLPKRVTSPSWGPPPPCKQALNFNVYIDVDNREIALARARDKTLQRILILE